MLQSQSLQMSDQSKAKMYSSVSLRWCHWPRPDPESTRKCHHVPQNTLNVSHTRAKSEICRTLEDEEGFTHSRKHTLPRTKDTGRQQVRNVQEKDGDGPPGLAAATCANNYKKEMLNHGVY